MSVKRKLTVPVGRCLAMRAPGRRARPCQRGSRVRRPDSCSGRARAPVETGLLSRSLPGIIGIPREEGNVYESKSSSGPSLPMRTAATRGVESTARALLFPEALGAATQASFPLTVGGSIGQLKGALLSGRVRLGLEL